MALHSRTSGLGSDDLLRQAVEAERAGFDAVVCSDHLAPWWPPDKSAPAHSGNAWVWWARPARPLKASRSVPAVTALVHRYNPVVIAQQIATLEALNPERALLGVGSGEAMNDVPAGYDRGPPGEQLARTEEALSIIVRLLAGETVDFQGRYFRASARACTRARRAGRRSTCRRSASRRRRSRAGWPRSC